MAHSNPDEFDGYRKWLGLANKGRIPTHYELLGISLDEDDPDVIRATAEQRRQFVETKRGEGHDAVVTEILYRIGEAETTLLNEEMRRDYDRAMHLFEKRRKNRQVDPFAFPSRAKSRPGRTVGEDGGIVKTFAGIMAVVVFGFGGMAWFSFGLPWLKKPALQPEAVQQAVVPQPILQPFQQPVQTSSEVAQVEPEPVKVVELEKPKDAIAEAIKALDGEWECVALQQNGSGGLTLRDDKLKSQDRRVKFNGNTFEMMRTRDEKRSGYTGKVIINPQNGHFDFIGKGPAGALNEWVGIYSIEGDTLKLCYRVKNNDKATRPTEFKTDNSDDTNTFVFEQYRRVASGTAQLSNRPSNWKFWDVFGNGLKKDLLVVARDGMLVVPATDKGFCLTTVQEPTAMTFKLEFQFQKAEGLGNPYVGIVSTLPDPAAAEWKQQIPRSVQIKLDPKNAGELVLPTTDFKVKLVEGQRRVNSKQEAQPDGRNIAPLNRAEIKLREWNTLEVTCGNDGKMVAKINGVTVNRLAEMQRSKGHIVIWPAAVEMRLRNAVVVSGDKETKLSFDDIQ